MPIVQSAGALQSFTEPRTLTTSSGGGGFSFLGYSTAYGLMYAQQPNVRTCVDFLSRNIAQLGVHAFRRVSDTDRERLHDHDVVRWLAKPNPATVRYRLLESLVGDIGIYYNAFWFKIRTTDGGRRRVGLVRLPPDEITADGGLLPRRYIWTNAAGQRIEIPTTDLVTFIGYNPLNPLEGLSPLETLRRTLAEEAAATAHRAAYWLNASRVEGVIERPKDAPRWSPEQKQLFMDQMQSRYTGVASVGRFPVLEDGMAFKQISFSAKDSEYINARKLGREEVAAAYHIPLPMVGILDHATFSNIREQHKQLYADTLGPWLEWLEEELEAQLLPESDDREDVYLEFNIADKLKGAFEEQSAALKDAVGRPFMTANEARARLNLPRQDDESADELAEQQGGPAAATRSTVNDQGSVEGEVVGSNLVRLLPRDAERTVRAAWTREASRVKRFPPDQRPTCFDHARAVRELACDLAPWLGTQAPAYATRVATETYALLRAGAEAFGADREVPPCVTRTTI
jgi:HK97 family phage portal protein